jgi:hypothetical protein
MNGQAYACFVGTRGIQQGCPLSSYLFVMAIKELSLLLRHALTDVTPFAGIRLGPNCPPINSLLFADGLLIYGEAPTMEARHIKQTLQNFRTRSGRLPNWSKSGIVFSKAVDTHTREQIGNIFPVTLVDETFVHPLIMPAKSRKEAYNFSRVSLNQSFQLIRQTPSPMLLALNSSNQSFSPSMFTTCLTLSSQKKFLAKITSIIRGGWARVNTVHTTKPLYLAAWKNICAPKKEGGLGIRNLTYVNRGLILPSAWRIAG